jgi:hypothetical protein
MYNEIHTHSSQLGQSHWSILFVKTVRSAQKTMYNQTTMTIRIKVMRRIIILPRGFECIAFWASRNMDIRGKVGVQENTGALW